MSKKFIEQNKRQNQDYYKENQIDNLKDMSSQVLENTQQQIAKQELDMKYKYYYLQLMKDRKKKQSITPKKALKKDQNASIFEDQPSKINCQRRKRGKTLQDQDQSLVQNSKLPQINNQYNSVQESQNLQDFGYKSIAKKHFSVEDIVDANDLYYLKTVSNKKQFNEYQSVDSNTKTIKLNDKYNNNFNNSQIHQSGRTQDVQNNLKHSSFHGSRSVLNQEFDYSQQLQQNNEKQFQQSSFNENQLNNSSGGKEQNSNQQHVFNSSKDNNNNIQKNHLFLMQQSQLSQQSQPHTKLINILNTGQQREENKKLRLETEPSTVDIEHVNKSKLLRLETMVTDSQPQQLRIKRSNSQLPNLPNQKLFNNESKVKKSTYGQNQFQQIQSQIANISGNNESLNRIINSRQNNNQSAINNLASMMINNNSNMSSNESIRIKDIISVQSDDEEQEYVEVRQRTQNLRKFKEAFKQNLKQQKQQISINIKLVVPPVQKPLQSQQTTLIHCNQPQENNTQKNSEKCKILLNLFFLIFNDLIIAIDQKKFEVFVHKMCILLEKCCEIQEIEFFIDVLYVICQFAQDLEQYNAQVFFNYQGVIFCDLTQSFHKKPKFLLNMANAANNFKDFEIALKILKKALQYAWYLKDLQLEFQIYEQMSLNYFYLGYLKEAKYFHERFMQGDSELDSSPNKMMGLNDLAFFIKLLPCKYTQFYSVLLVKLSLPLRNIFYKKEIKQKKYGNNLESSQQTQQLQQSLEIVEQTNEIDQAQQIKLQQQLEQEQERNQLLKHINYNIPYNTFYDSMPFTENYLMKTMKSDYSQNLDVKTNVTNKESNKNQQNEEEVYQYCDFGKEYNFKNANGITIMTDYLKSFEFQFNVPSPRNSKLQLEKNQREEIQKQFPKDKFEIDMQKLQKMKQLPPQKLIEHKTKISKQKPQDFQTKRFLIQNSSNYLSSLIQQIKYQVGSNFKSKKLNEVIQLNHMTQEKKFKLQMKINENSQLIKKYNQIFDKLIIDTASRLDPQQFQNLTINPKLE